MNDLEPSALGGTDLTERAWLLQNRLNPFPIAGCLRFDGSALTFTLLPMAQQAALGWLEARLDRPGLKDDLQAGAEVEVFRLHSPGSHVTWPRMYAGSGLEATDDAGRSWLVVLDYPSGGSLSKTISLLTGRKKGKVWQQALAG